MLLKFSKEKLLKYYMNIQIKIVYVNDIQICFENEVDHGKHLDIFISLCKDNGIIFSRKRKYNI